MVSIVRRLLLVSGVCLLAILLSSQSSFAQAPPAAAAPAASGSRVPIAKGSKKTSINFEDQLIEGQAAKPELFYMIQQNNKNFKRLIQLRENFLPEMRKTSEDVVRKGSGT